jgi:ComF family protein
VLSFLNYEKDNSVSRLIREIKYRGDKALGYEMGQYFGRELEKHLLFRDVDLVVPVPLHRRKKRMRGFNQSEYIARGLADILKIPLDSRTLYRKVYNPTQTRKSRQERWENVEGIFAVRNASVFSGRHLLLVDDVITTGATLEACASAILSATEARISIVSLALAR